MVEIEYRSSDKLLNSMCSCSEHNYIISRTYACLIEEE